MRAAAIRLSERWITQPNHALTPLVLKLVDEYELDGPPELAATVGELPAGENVRGPDHPVAVRRRPDYCRRGGERFGRHRGRGPRGDSSAKHEAERFGASGAVSRSGNVAAVEQLVASATDSSVAAATAWASSRALISGCRRRALAAADAAASGAAADPGSPAPVRPVALAAEPKAFTTWQPVRRYRRARQARRAKLECPNKPAPVVSVTALTAEEQSSSLRARALQERLLGLPSARRPRPGEGCAPLVESRYTTGTDGGAAARILLAGKEGPIGLMPPLGGALSDEQIASVLTTCGASGATPVRRCQSRTCSEVRGLTKTRTRPWTDASSRPPAGGGEGGAVTRRATCYGATCCNMLTCYVLRATCRATCSRGCARDAHAHGTSHVARRT